MTTLTSHRLIRAGLALALIAVALVAAPPVSARDGDVAGMTAMTRLFDGLPHRIIHADPYAYVALDTGIQVFDVTSPASPTLVSGLSLDSPASISS